MQTELLLAVPLTILVGVSLGLLGSGGAILMLPILVYVADVPAKEAVGISLAVVGGTSLVAARVHLRRGRVHWQAALSFISTGVVGSYYGSRLTHLVTPHLLMLLFSMLMLLVGWAMLRSRPEPTATSPEFSIFKCLLIGGLVGVLTGFLGVGGGFLIVPALVLLIGIPTVQAIGTSLTVIAVNSVSGLIGHLGEAPMDWTVVGVLLASSLTGMIVGSWCATRVPEQRLKWLFAWFVVLFGVLIAAINLYGIATG